MRVVHVSTHDVAGGAARAAYRIHRSLIDAGVQSSMLVAVRGSSDPTVSEVRIARSLQARGRRWMLRQRMRQDWESCRTDRPAGFERFSDDRTELGRDLVQQLPSADVIHLHWIADFLDYREFFRRLPPRTPLVWTLHDMNPFTGGCHYDAGCDRFTRACGACPQLGSSEEHDLSRAIWERKMEALTAVEPGRMHVVGGSVWVREMVQRSSLLGRFPVSSFHYGIDAEVFSPRDRTRARAELGIPQDARVVLFVADSVENRRKGFAQLLAALEQLPTRLDVRVVSIGAGEVSAPGDVPHLHLGRVDDDRKLATVYSAADLFVIPSLQEAYGQTALEAIACGTPAVGFDTGGMRDVIRDGVTGALVPIGDTGALASRVESLLSDPPRLSEMRRHCREVVEREHTLHGEAAEYIGIYRGLLQP
jgi:glycosyltransferase involved in cell wall biosynthesis